VVADLGFAPPTVCANGAVLYDPAHDRVLHAETLSADLLAEVAELAASLLPGVGIGAERVALGVREPGELTFITAPEYQQAWLPAEPATVASAADVVSEPAVKLLLRVPGAASAEMAAAIAPHLGGRAHLSYSTNNGLLELAAPGVTKASGLLRLAELTGASTAHLLAFGDMPNDIPMLELAHRGVAVDNAHPATKEAADEVTAAHHEDGVALVIERWWS
jgi:hydroxymethylpyrimidine pyrophosphatase-like HAD family hydrolase